MSKIVCCYFVIVVAVVFVVVSIHTCMDVL